MRRLSGLISSVATTRLRERGIYLSVVDSEKFRKRAQQAYEWALPDPASRLLTWTWPRWIPLDENARALKGLRGSRTSSLRAACRPWSSGAARTMSSIKRLLDRFKQLLPHAEGPHLVTGRHFLQEDSGPEIAGLIVDFLARNQTEF